MSTTCLLILRIIVYVYICFMLLDLHTYTYTSHYAPLRSRAIRRLVLNCAASVF